MFRNVLSVTSLALVFAFFATPTFAGESLKKVDNEKVCMVTNTHFQKKQIPVVHQGKTYYGCCENCKATLATDAKARTATDPVSGKPVDKATAYIVAREDDTVLYFENEKTFKKFAARSTQPSVDHSQHKDHSNH